ncbi:MAG TPA: MerR family transcriptional regulator [Rhizobiales bacterium]|nr:MerR family transcriptional regulator [Hyphomicrobiales bacterium]
MTSNLLNDRPEMTLEDVCIACGLGTDTIVTYVQEGLIDVPGDNAASWRFSETQIVHIQKATRLEHDLRLNPAGSVLVLELLARIEDLQSQLRRFERGQG